ncbi:peptide-methionine (S)-S-oxide reductase MsrA [Nannocystis sp. RBIL2]|uniref:peptide-methionine (S)-S-oxide reductase MsrA n=1 Tax=Nannocystis sp. RBIL2 TaxID=2996788 RepID=UPI00226F37A0|nr:peptide-methionine (S)-S-oxide reductase MsrA [Nannocystis sp. RBIL2]MCY1070310.1 peptide-methionine (S)-S-oxide reductase MsrA [Nannocystis sp. RBIL2]
MLTTTRRLFIGLIALAAACGTTESNHKKPAPAAAPTQTASGATELGYFAGGCFWGVEHFLEQLPGVIDVESGYMGGPVDAPTYEQVSSGVTGHAETVRVTFDPQQIGYEAVAKRFFEIHDPTEVDRQGPDIGPQYRTAVFVTGPEQRAIVDSLIARLKANGYAVATTVEDAGKFWSAEEYHQNYYVRTRKTPYCHMPVPRFDQRASS